MFRRNMNKFKEEIRKQAKNKRKFYKIYTKGRDGKKIYQGSIPFKKRKEHMYISTVSCFVIDEEGRVLVEKRGKSESEPGKYDLVSGHVDNNETPTQTVIREYVEELHNGSDEEREKAKNEAIQNVKKLIELDLTFINDKGKTEKYFIQFYALRTKLKTQTLSKDEVESIERIPLEEVFGLIRQGKINFQYDKRFEKLFQQVREYFQGKKQEKEIA